MRAQNHGRIVMTTSSSGLYGNFGSFECAHVTMTRGVSIGDASDAVEQIRGRLDDIRARSGEMVPASGWEQYKLGLAKAGLATEVAAACVSQ